MENISSHLNKRSYAITSDSQQQEFSKFKSLEKFVCVKEMREEKV